MEQRKATRYQVQFRSVFSSSSMVGGEGSVVDLSENGCRIASAVQPLPRTILEVRIVLPDPYQAFMAEECIVRWARAKEFGLEFVKVQESERRRLLQLLSTVAFG
jgi:hypothetical protein